MISEFLHVNTKLSFLDRNIENDVHIYGQLFTIFLLKNKHINWLFLGQRLVTHSIFLHLFFKMVSY